MTAPPTTTIEERVAALEGSVGSLAVRIDALSARTDDLLVMALALRDRIHPEGGGR